MANLRNFTRRLFIIFNLIVIILFLLACANPWLHPAKWWFISLLGLVFPLLLFALACFFVIDLFIASYRKWAVVSLAAMLIGWSNIHSFLGMHPGGKRFSLQKAPNTVRLMTWNVRNFDEAMTKKRGANGHRLKMYALMDSLHPDVLCLQEFYQSGPPGNRLSNIAFVRDSLHLPYYYFSRDYIRADKMHEAGVALFSRYPIVDSSLLRYSVPDGLKATESLLSADVKIGSDTIRFFTTHLQSVLFRSKEFHDIEIIKNVDDSIFFATKSITKKLRYAFRHRAEQAEQVRSQLDRSPYPSVMCGDFNDVPNSYTYHKIRGDWHDAFLKKGFGIGRTYVNISPTLRIDYILASPDFDVLQCNRFITPYSDHHPVVADLKLP